MKHVTCVRIYSIHVSQSLSCSNSGAIIAVTYPGQVAP